MSGKIMIQNKHSKIFFIEFLRVFFIFFIILGHIKERYPDVGVHILNFFHTAQMHTWFGVEFFFIIGGFFLYKKLKDITDAQKIIKNLYIRLMPALLFVFVLCFLFGTSFARLPLIMTLTSGIGLPGEAIGWGDWYVCTYFWCCLLYIGIFYANQKKAFLWTGILMYITLHLKFHAPYSWMGTYFDIICSDFIRGIYSVGLGIVAGYLNDKVKITPKTGSRIFFTIFEGVALVSVFNYIARYSHNHYNFWEMEIIFAALLICAYGSFGYITSFLNKCSFIQNISKYVYSIFLCHIVCMIAMIANNNFNLPDFVCAYIIFAGAILLGVFEYHVIEQRFVPWVLNYFNKDSKNIFM